MFFDDFFIHDIQIVTTKEERDTSVYPPKINRITTVQDVKGLMDTPTTSDALTYMQREIKLTLFLYLPYHVEVGKTDIIIYEGNKFEVTGSLEDQGGQHQVNRIPLSKVTG